jgi:competence protein ComGF
MQALALIVINLMAMAIYIPYLLDKERKYDNQTDTTSKPIRTGHIHQATTSQ